MSEWLLRRGSGETDPVALARHHQVLEYELDGREFRFECEVVPNEWAGKGVAVLMHLDELAVARKDTICACDLAAAFDQDELPDELDLPTIVRCRSREDGLFADVADRVRNSVS